MEQVFSYPFRLCKYNGESFIPDGRMFDGCDAINLYRTNLKTLKLD